MSKQTVVIYHADCLDGFGGAYAAWKKLGDAAEYRPKKHGEAPPDDLSGCEVFMIDFSYEKEVLERIEKEAASFVILDHHMGARDAVESMKNHIFDNDRSGASIAWSYFNPDTSVPRLISYIEDNDLWRNSLKNAGPVAAYLSTLPWEFPVWDRAMSEFQDDAQFEKIVEKGSHYREYVEHALTIFERDAELVEFEGHTVYAVNVPRLFRSELGNILAKKHPPFAIVWYAYGSQWRCSLRGTGEVDVSKIAAKYGGNGHHNAASFRIPDDQPFPWTPVGKQSLPTGQVKE